MIPPSEVAKADTVEETIKGAGGVFNKWNNYDSKIGEQVGTKTVETTRASIFDAERGLATSMVWPLIADFVKVMIYESTQLRP